VPCKPPGREDSKNQSEDEDMKMPASRGRKNSLYEYAKSYISGASSDSRSTHMRSPPHKTFVFDEEDNTVTTESTNSL